MAISPQFLSKELKERDEKELEMFERNLDAKLNISFTNGKTTSIWLNKAVPFRLQEELRKRYVEAGWSDVKFITSSDQRDCGAVEVVFCIEK